MPVPINVQASTNVFIETSDSVLSDGKDGSTALKATPTVAITKPTSWDGTAFQLIKQAVTGSITSLVGITNTVGLGRYNATPPTLTDGDHRALQLDGNGCLKSSAIARPYVFTDRSGTTSGTTNVWTVVSAVNINRQQITIENASVTATLIVGFGATGSEIVIAGGTIPPGSSTGNHIFQCSATQQINIKSVTSSIPFLATEGAYT